VRFEHVDLDAGHVVVTVAEDLDCSGLPASDETVCAYDEGFLASVLDSFTGLRFSVTEVDCWASGSRVCRFDARVRGS
jgi:predicted hydrocarbon binding protein